MLKIDWQPMNEAPKDRRILLRYDRPFLENITVVIGQYNYDKGIMKPKPYWSNDLMRCKGCVVLDIKKARNNPPIGWMEIPEANNN